MCSMCCLFSAGVNHAFSAQPWTFLLIFLLPLNVSLSVGLLDSSLITLLWSHFGSVSDRCSEQCSSSQHRAHYLAGRRPHPSQMTEISPASLLLPLVRVHQASADMFKHWPPVLVCWALNFRFSPSLFTSQCLWPLVAHHAWQRGLQLSSQMAMIVLQGKRK